jgi:hypothetical protein
MHSTTPEERSRAFTILFFSLMCLGAGQSVMFAILPSLARKLGLTEFQASLPFVTSAAIWVFSSGFWGARSDLWGRKPVMLLGLVAFGISFGLFAVMAQLGIAALIPVAAAYPLMIAARALYGILGRAPRRRRRLMSRIARRQRSARAASPQSALRSDSARQSDRGSARCSLSLVSSRPFTSLRLRLSQVQPPSGCSCLNARRRICTSSLLRVFAGAMRVSGPSSSTDWA